MPHILIVEDEEKIANLLSDYLTKAGYQTTLMFDGNDVVSTVKKQNFDLILLDLMLPGKDGLTICREIQEFSKIAIIMITARVDEIDRLLGLELGADDYICKPVDPQLLLAKVRACLQRTAKVEQSDVLTIGNLTIDKNNRWARFEQQDISLSRHEFDLLWLLAANYGKQITREYLFVNTLKRSYDGLDRTIDGRVSRLRKKLLTYEGLTCRINTMWGQGYMLTVNE